MPNWCYNYIELYHNDFVQLCNIKDKIGFEEGTETEPEETYKYYQKLVYLFFSREDDKKDFLNNNSMKCSYFTISLEEKPSVYNPDKKFYLTIAFETAWHPPYELLTRIKINKFEFSFCAYESEVGYAQAIYCDDLNTHSFSYNIKFNDKKYMEKLFQKLECILIDATSIVSDYENYLEEKQEEEEEEEEEEEDDC